MSDDDLFDLEPEALELAAAIAMLRKEPRDRLVASARATSRFDDLEREVASLLDLDVRAAGALLLRVDDASSWTEGPAPGVRLFHVEGGPAVASAVTGFVRVEAGREFPEHEHLGDERVLVIQGALRDSHGHVVRRGEIAPMPAGSAHSFEAIGPLPLVYLVVVRDGVRIGHDVIGPDDPRG
ncbi:cupin domain-containing protein [Sandaracinus amylolyticus]|uniref:cupin domain-containing protein n=1 Tax=Sandaracinus amylolyticus TaxID=927083 RepID=UPI001F43587F|nr:cupin domain-containing protein [Sandaracinus amylolyticus]UJR82262.1 Hypothetical protein I5071_43270 [Sandaracinus amylolyticus]